MSVIEFEVPLPPKELRLNHRAQHWAARAKAADAYSEVVAITFGNYEAPLTTGPLCSRLPWDRASVTYTWRYAGVRPDIDNIAASIKVLQDSLGCAPAPNSRSKDKRERWYLGLVAEDGALEPVTFQREKVARRAAECVVVRIERIDEHAYCAQDWHRCADGGGKGEYDRYVRDADAHPR